MVRSQIAGYGRSSKTRCAACAIVLTLGAGLAGQAAAQALLAAAPGLAGSADTSIPLLAGAADEGECEPALASDLQRNHFSTLLASVEAGSPAARARNGGARSVPNEGLPFAAAAGGSAARSGAPLGAQQQSQPPRHSQQSPQSQQWDIVVADKTLNVTMARWAAQAGWQLLWELPVDYAVEAHTQVSGSFEEAVAIVARSMESAEIPMKAVFYQGNKVLRIMAKGSE